MEPVLRGPALVAVVLLAAGGAVRPLHAQAVCSAPHSSPTLTQSGAVGTLPGGAGWGQISLYQQRSDDFFGSEGERRPFLADSEFLTRSAFLTAAVGVIQGVELWAQVPVHRLTIEGAGGSTRSTGVGDIRLAARIGPELLGWRVPLALRFGVKLPGSEFPVDATVLPLTEGQRDAELSLESGHSFQGVPLSVVARAGYRVRAENEDAARDPGDEAFGHLAMGGGLGPLAWELAAEGLWGAAPRAQGLELPSDRRRLLQVVPTLRVSIAGGRLELTSQIPVAARNLPGGTGVSLGYRAAWGVPDP